MTELTLDPTRPIGIFDSGVGGLSVLQAIRTELPHENLFYLGDQGHVPYGPRPKDEIRDFAIGITRFLLNQGAKEIVVACNTASAAALHDLRDLFPTVPLVGMEPAVKPAAEITQTGKVGVLATRNTFKGDLYASLVKRYGKDIQLFQSTCPGLVEQVEAGKIDTMETRTILGNALKPMLEAGVDTIVLGCTHYPFVTPVIREIIGNDKRIIDPSPAVARQAKYLLSQRGLLNPKTDRGKTMYYTSGDSDTLKHQLNDLLGETADVFQVKWRKDFSLRAKTLK
jgi:glutamate racemase